jgi:hypothetical protein
MLFAGHTARHSTRFSSPSPTVTVPAPHGVQPAPAPSVSKPSALVLLAGHTSVTPCTKPMQAAMPVWLAAVVPAVVELPGHATQPAPEASWA